MAHVEITKRELAAIRSLKRLATRWPKSLHLLSWNGSLTICKEADDGRLASVDYVNGIPNDGGDPSDEEVKFKRERDSLREQLEAAQLALSSRDIYGLCPRCSDEYAQSLEDEIREDESTQSLAS